MCAAQPERARRSPNSAQLQPQTASRTPPYQSAVTRPATGDALRRVERGRTASQRSQAAEDVAGRGTATVARGAAPPRPDRAARRGPRAQGARHRPVARRRSIEAMRPARQTVGARRQHRQLARSPDRVGRGRALRPVARPARAPARAPGAGTARRAQRSQSPASANRSRIGTGRPAAAAASSEVRSGGAETAGPPPSPSARNGLSIGASGERHAGGARSGARPPGPAAA